MSDAATTYSLRQFVRYEHLIVGGHVEETDEAVESYARSFPERDLDQQLTFAQWLTNGAGDLSRTPA